MNEPLIELRNVDVTLNGRAILRDIHWQLRPGEHWSIVGANGSGKTSFLRLLRGELWPSPGGGERIYRLDEVAQWTAVGIRERVALVSPESQQRYLRQDWRLTARDVIHTGFAQGDLLYMKPDQEQKLRAGELATRLHITPLLARDVQTLSTGELRKVLIARALVGHAQILLLDEVCDGLDAAFRREMLSFIDDIARHGTQVIHTTHRSDEALPAITHELTMSSGRIVRSGLSERGRPRLRKREMVRTPQAAEAVIPASVDGPPLISIRHADVFLGRKKVLRGIEWCLRAGEHWVVLGGNGAGKTTFLKLVASELYPAAGAKVRRFDLKPADTIWDLRRRIGVVSPLLQTQYRENLSAREVVASGFFSSIGLIARVSRSQQHRVNVLLNEIGLSALADRRMDQLSFGELRKLLMLRAMVHRPQLLIFDEPFDGLDLASRQDFGSALDRVAANGTQLLIVTHHLNDLPPSINRGLFLESGTISMTGRWPDIRVHPKIVELFGRQ